ncbi:MAG: hypothetical protein RBU28_07995 [Bacteroidales bacterium]|jgi:hypothetical protein|nr:hypothetical protein [Bacteroidales bacterium]MDX9812315.1 hypothetical protein [Bacteroidales bacterium]NLD63569.1 hypothetical protein [Bacteroidales bacterium]HOC48070.1 hypothetical protein [Bacteroidales bacterium]
MKKRVFLGIIFIALVSIMALKQLMAVKAIDAGELCTTWCIPSTGDDCTLHAGDSNGTYTIICHDKLWP